MQRALSGNTLFHFTSHFDSVISIIKNGFYPRLCFEDDVEFKPSDRLPDKIIPMVSFCDMRISDAIKGRHTSDYGNYAIGIDKTWARQQGVSPILYIPDNISFNIQGLALIHGNILELMKESHPLSQFSRIQSGLGSMLFYMKRYEGYLYKNWEKKPEKIVFYDEREWRYVPIVVDTGEPVFLFEVMKDLHLFAREIFYANEADRFEDPELELSMTNREYVQKQNEELEHQALKIPIEKVKYIVLEKNEEIGMFKLKLKEIGITSDKIEQLSIYSIQDLMENVI